MVHVPKDQADDVGMEDDDEQDEAQFLPSLQVIVRPQEQTKVEEGVSSLQKEETQQPAASSSDEDEVTKGSLLAGYLEFYFAKQRGGLDPLSLNDQEKGTPPFPPPSKGTLAICLVSLFTQQPLRSVSSSSPSSSSTSSSSSSSSSPSSFDLTFGFFDIHFPSTQRCDESDRFEHP